MSQKEQILSMLKGEFNRWEELLVSLSEAQIIAPFLPADYSIKDKIAHLMAWQQVSIARLEAAKRNSEPVLPNWLAGSDPESEEDIDQYNARIYEIYAQKSWSYVYQSWRDGFLRFIELGEQIPGDDLLDHEKYPWLKGYPLIAVLRGSYEHHHVDHLEPLIALLDQHRDKESIMTSRINISSGAKWEDIVGYSRAVRVGGVIEVAGTTAVDQNGRVVGVDDPYRQTMFILSKIEKALIEAGAGLKDVVRTRIFVTDISQWEEIGRAHGEYFREIKPASTMVEVKSLINPDMLVEIEVTAFITK